MIKYDKMINDKNDKITRCLKSKHFSITVLAVPKTTKYQK